MNLHLPYHTIPWPERRQTYVTFPDAGHHRPMIGTKLYCLVTEAHVCEQLAQGCYLKGERPGVEPATFCVRGQQRNHYTTRPPKNWPLSLRDPGPDLIHGFMGPTECTPQTASRLVQPLRSTTHGCIQQTDTHTHHETSTTRPHPL